MDFREPVCKGGGRKSEVFFKVCLWHKHLFYLCNVFQKDMPLQLPKNNEAPSFVFCYMYIKSSLSLKIHLDERFLLSKSECRG